MIVPPATLGIVGGGQLGRYFVLAARSMGYSTIVLEPDAASPAGAVADVHLVAPYDDPQALERLATDCAAVTVEFENAPAAALRRLERATAVRPSSHAVAVTQDRRREKRFLAAAGIPIAPFAVIDDAHDIRDIDRGLFPAILKTAQLGYDGKGQTIVASHAELGAAWDDLGGVPAVVEQRLALDAEVSVILARSTFGGGDAVPAAYPLTVNIHRSGILDVSVVPGPFAPEAFAIAERIVESLEYIGVLAVEMFVVDGELVVNEIAPRPHNSGHWTLDFSVTSQFEQQVRAVCGLALGDTSLTVDAAAMANLLGDEWAAGEPDWSAVLGENTAKLRIYGKEVARPGRKMGHISAAAGSPAEAEQLVRRLRSALRPATGPT